MSVTLKRLTAAAATAVLAAGITIAATSNAHAATPSCGSTCVNPYNGPLGHRYLLDVYKRGQNVGQPIILFRATNTDPALDFTYADQGTVTDFIAAGLISKADGIKYGTEQAYELEYAPYGADTGLCVGLAATAAQDGKVSLQPCGVSSKTVWVIDTADGSQFGTIAFNGSSTNFSHPYALTYTGDPESTPRPQLYVAELQEYATGTAYDSQLWRYIPGPVF